MLGACASASSIFMCATVTWGRIVDSVRETPVLVNEADVDKWCVSLPETSTR